MMKLVKIEALVLPNGDIMFCWNKIWNINKPLDFVLPNREKMGDMIIETISEWE